MKSNLILAGDGGGGQPAWEKDDPGSTPAVGPPLMRLSRGRRL
jgi:hypothetical protein